MTISPPFELREIPTSSAWMLRKAEDFLLENGLELDRGIGYLLGVYDSDDNLVGTGGLDGDTIKCIALHPETRGLDLASSLIGSLYSKALEEGARSVKVFTKPENRRMFESLGFSTVGTATGAIMLENGFNGIGDYLKALREMPRGERNGVIVMNANPPTLGHQYLIREAARQVDRLTVIPVAENIGNDFSEASRIRVLKALTAAIPNAEVAPSSPYTISSSTFPSYFLKKKTAVAKAQMELDLDIFGRHIAPALAATVRFAGTEPIDEMTRAYNDAMRRILPDFGIETVEIDRLQSDGGPVSASQVRRLLGLFRTADAMALTPRATWPLLVARAATLALHAEAALTPKPGLVDRADSGSHTDMDFALMTLSADTVGEGFSEMALLAWEESDIGRLTAGLVEIGKDTERRMLAATGGVNTHRGAIFSLGLTVAAACRILATAECLRGEFTPQAMSAMIARLAAGIDRPDDTHGERVRRRHGGKGALDMARDGYTELFGRWLPEIAGRHTDENALLRLLLRIISELDDTNAIHRAGAEEALAARREAADLLKDFSTDGLRRLNESFIRRNLSHGGAADMLALTILAASLFENK